jgi:hypothetical protein
MIDGYLGSSSDEDQRVKDEPPEMRSGELCVARKLVARRWRPNLANGQLEAITRE